MIPLIDERLVMVGLNSTVIAGVNSKRFRLTVYPVSTNPVYVRSAQAATVLGGAAVAFPAGPLVFGGDGKGAVSGQQFNAAAVVDQTPILVIDEFWS